jgi:hypothetical protein
VPETVTAVWEATLAWVTLNVALDLPAGIVTVAGMDTADVLLLERVTFEPPVGANPVNVTVPVTVVLLLPWKVLGETEIEARDAG